MFERYTEGARRVLFFARYETSQLGSTAIETEHVLLGVIRGSQGLVKRILTLSQVSVTALRKEIEERSRFREKIGTSVEIPFSAETKRVLGFAAEEADRLRHSYIGTEHLLLALLREETSVAGSVLTRHGLRLDEVRNMVVKLLAEPSTAPTASSGEVFDQIDHIKHLVDELAGLKPDNSNARALADRIHESLDRLEQQLGE